MAEPATARRPTRFARLWPDGSMSVERVDMPIEEARAHLEASDPDVELLEIEVVVVRTHGKPRLHAVTEHSARCPCCGEMVSIEVPHA